MKPDIEKALESDPKYKPEVMIPTDDDLTAEELFKKYMLKRFPLKVAQELINYYPDFQFDNYEKLEKLKNKSAFFYGKPGTGKTFHAIALVLLSRKVSWWYLSTNVRFYRVPELNRELRRLATTDEIDRQNGLRLYDSLVKKISHCTWLILDDLGIEKNSDFTLEVLDQVIDTRYQENRNTILTTNFDLDRLLKHEDYIRIMSRILEMVDGQPIQLTKTYRKTNITPKRF